MVIQCKNLISLYVLPDQRRVNLLVYYKVRIFSYADMLRDKVFMFILYRIVIKFQV